MANKLPRSDYNEILSWIPNKARVLDLGCGDGTLLEALVSEKNATAIGIELDETLVLASLEKGLSVYQGTLEEGLADYPDGAFDFVVLNQTLQTVKHPVQVLNAMVRVGKQAIVGFPNFGHWQIRLNLLLSGQMPSSPSLPYSWHNTPNIHLFTWRDFENLCAEQDLLIEKFAFQMLEPNVLFKNSWQKTEAWPGAANWMASQVLCQISQENKAQ